MHLSKYISTQFNVFLADTIPSKTSFEIILLYYYRLKKTYDIIFYLFTFSLGYVECFKMLSIETNFQIKLKINIYFHAIVLKLHLPWKGTMNCVCIACPQLSYRRILHLIINCID
jgi:hypothetical protein